MGKLLKLAVVAAAVYFFASFCYDAAVKAKLLGQLGPSQGSNTELKSLKFDDWYLEGDLRFGSAKLVTKSLRTTPENPRGLAATETPVAIQVTGRYWPDTVRHSPLPRK